MEVILNTDKNIKGTEHLKDRFAEEIKKKLTRFEEYVTRMEIFLGDENNKKSGVDDKYCTLEARIKNAGTAAATHHADTLDHALNGAIEKMKSILNTKVGQMHSH